MKKLFWVLFSFALANVLYSQEIASEKTTAALVDKPASDFLPKRLVKDGMLFAEINGRDVFKIVALVVEPKSDGKFRFRYAIRYPDNSLHISGAGLTEQGNKKYSGIKEIKSPTSPSDHVLLRLQCDLTTREIQYSWLDKNGKAFDHPVIIGTENGIYKNQPMPSFEFNYFDGTKGSSTDFEGKPLVINWWHTSCLPCVDEIPGLNKLVEKYGGQGVSFLAITPDNEERLQKFFKKYDFLYQQAKVEISELSFWGSSFPRHIIVSNDGIVVYDRDGGSKDIYQILDGYIEQTIK